jgi:hypothetical protein
VRWSNRARVASPRMDGIEVGVIFVVVGGLFCVAVAEGTIRLLGRGSRKPPPRHTRRLIYPTMAFGLTIGAICAWAFTSHHQGVGVAVLIASFLIPEAIILPLRIRRSRRAADAARAQRRSHAE